MNLLYIHWNPDPVLFHIGNFGLRWYSIFWMIAILAACQVVYKLYQVKKLPIDTYQSLFVYCMVGVFVGAVRDCTPYPFSSEWRVDIYGVCRTCQPRRNIGFDYRPLSFLPENQDTLLGCA